MQKRLVQLLIALLSVYLFAIVVYSTVEHKTLFDSMWWGLMTMTTVGYGDEYPHSVLGKISGMLLVSSAVFVLVPTLTAFIASKLIVDGDEWTHDEQEEVKSLLREISTTIRIKENV